MAGGSPVAVKVGVTDAIAGVIVKKGVEVDIADFIAAVNLG